jgi:hypothetical protein
VIFEQVVAIRNIFSSNIFLCLRVKLQFERIIQFLLTFLLVLDKIILIPFRSLYQGSTISRTSLSVGDLIRPSVNECTAFYFEQ